MAFTRSLCETPGGSLIMPLSSRNPGSNNFLFQTLRSGTLRSSDFIFLLLFAIVLYKVLFCFLGCRLHWTMQTSAAELLKFQVPAGPDPPAPPPLPARHPPLAFSEGASVFTLRGRYGESGLLGAFGSLCAVSLIPPSFFCCLFCFCRSLSFMWVTLLSGDKESIHR